MWLSLPPFKEEFFNSIFMIYIENCATLEQMATQYAYGIYYDHHGLEYSVHIDSWRFRVQFSAGPGEGLFEFGCVCEHAVESLTVEKF